MTTISMTAEPETAQNPASTIETFVQHMIDQNLQGLLGLYSPGALWEIHVPGWDGVISDPEEMRDRHVGYFGRLDFRVVAYDIISQGNDVGLRWDLEWTDRDDGAPCASFQSHFFHVEGGQIRRHWMYCAGVRANAE